MSEQLKLTTYFGERDRVEGRLLADALLDLYGEHQLLCSVLLRGAEGFGAPHHVRTDRLLSLSEDLPAVTVAVDSRERIEAVLPSVRRIQHRGLITVERVSLVAGRGASTSLPLAPLASASTRQPLALPTAVQAKPIASEPPPFGPHSEIEQESKLTVYVGRHQRVQRLPAYVAITQLLRECGIAGASVLLGVDGTIGGRRLRAKFIGRNTEVPAVVIAVGSRSRIAEVLSDLSRVVNDPLMTLERVRICKRDGTLFSAPHELPATDERGWPLWQKLTVYTSQSATHAGRPLSLELIRRLRASDAAGATSLRGIWGFHDDHVPHGDRFLQLRRHVPVLMTVLDAPERIEKAFAIIDELTVDQGLVTSEMAPAMQAIYTERPLGDTALTDHRC